MASIIQNRAKPVHGLRLVLLLSSTEVIGEKKKKIQPEDRCNTIFRKMQPCFLIMYNLFKDIQIMCSF